MHIEFIDDSDPGPFESHCVKRRRDAKVVFDLGVPGLEALARLTSGSKDFELPPLSFTTRTCKALAAAGVIDGPQREASLTPQGIAFVTWLTQPGITDSLLIKRREFFRQVALTSPRIRGLLLLLHYPRKFPSALSSSQEIRSNVAATLTQYRAIYGEGGMSLTDSGLAVATWFSPSTDYE